MRLIGSIVRLQIQEASLKVGQPPQRRYDPSPIRAMPSLILDEGGVTGLDAEGRRLADVHHRAHPRSKHRGENGVSLGFTSHYALMRAEFGDHLTDGIAGENILVATDRRFAEADLAADLTIETAAGELIRLDEIVAAAPCVEFSRYALRYPDDARPDETVAAALRFLMEGVRGFYASRRGPAARIAVGDRVYLTREGRGAWPSAPR